MMSILDKHAIGAPLVERVANSGLETFPRDPIPPHVTQEEKLRLRPAVLDLAHGPTCELATLLSGLLSAGASGVDSCKVLALALVDLPALFAVGVVRFEDVALRRVAAKSVNAADRIFDLYHSTFTKRWRKTRDRLLSTHPI